MNNRLALAVSVALVVLFTPLVLQAQGTKARRTKCANNLRQMGLAALMYADDKRFFPHVGNLRELDGDVTTNHTPVSMRLLMCYGYLDNSEVFVCPESYDGTAKRPKDEDYPGKNWFWAGNTLNPNPKPILQQRLLDPTLNATTELSFGWTRRAHNNNVRSTTVVLADRAVNQPGAENTPLAGNHAGGWNVVTADCAVSYREISDDPFPGSYLSAVEQVEGAQASAGYLPIKPQVDASGFAEPYTKPRRRPGKLQLPKPASKEGK